MKNTTQSKRPLKVLSLLCCLLLFYGARGQTNLVKNPGFEISNACVLVYSDADTMSTEHDQLFNHVGPWQSATNGSPDYFNPCRDYTCINGKGHKPNGDSSDAVNYFVNVPFNLFGYQQTHGGSDYAGIIVNYDDRKEYLEGKLSDTLKPNTAYRVGFWVSLANGSYFALKNLGAYMSSGLFFEHVVTNISQPPGIIDTGTVADTANWIHIEGIYIAQGGEDHITIGHFGTVASDRTTLQQGPSCYPPSNWAYYFIDDVSVTEITCCEKLSTEIDMIQVFTRPPSPDSCYYSLDITSDSGACTVTFAKVVDVASGSVILGLTPLSGGTIYPGSGRHGNVLADPDFLRVYKFHGKKAIRTILYDSLGNEVCSIIDTLESCNCCSRSYYNPTIAASAGQPGKCCYSMSFATTSDACDIGSVSIIDLNGHTIISQTYLNGGIILAGQSRANAVNLCVTGFWGYKAIYVTVYGTGGTALCSWTDTLRGCFTCVCDTSAITAKISSNEVGTTLSEYCGYYLTLNSKDSGVCSVKSIKIVDVNTGSAIVPLTDISGGVLTPGSGQRVALTNIGIPKFSGKRAVRITMYDENGIQLPCQVIDTVVGCGNCDGCNFVNNLHVRTERTTSSAGDCCVKIFLENTGSCDMDLKNGFIIGEYAGGHFTGVADGSWQGSILTGNSYVTWKNPSGPNVIAGHSEIYLGNLCLSNDQYFHRVVLGVTSSGDQYEMCDGSEDTLTCACVDTACQHASQVIVTGVQKQNSSGCCWSMMVKNTGPCALYFKRGLALGTNKQITSAGGSGWPLLGWDGAKAVWSNSDPANNIILPGATINIGTICVDTPDSVKIWLMVIDSLRQTTTGSLQVWSCVDTPATVLSCACTDSACNNPNKIKMRVEKVPGANCCWNVFAKDTGKCDLILSQGIGVGTEVAINSVTGGQWSVNASGTSTVTWTDPANTPVVLKAGQEVWLGKFCFTPPPSKSKIWRFIPPCNDQLIGQVDCSTGKGIGKAGIATGTEEPVELLAEENMFLAYPNPFGDVLNIHYKLEHDADVKIEIFDMSGRLVDTIRDHYMQVPEGKLLRYNAAALAKGAYLMKLSSGSQTSTIHLIK